MDECIFGGATYGICKVEDNVPSTPFIAFVVPFLFRSWVKLNQLSPLVSVDIGLLLRKTAAKGATTATALTWDFTSRRGHSM